MSKVKRGSHANLPVNSNPSTNGAASCSYGHLGNSSPSPISSYGVGAIFPQPAAAKYLPRFSAIDFLTISKKPLTHRLVLALDCCQRLLCNERKGCFHVILCILHCYRGSDLLIDSLLQSVLAGILQDNIIVQNDCRCPCNPMSLCCLLRLRVQKVVVVSFKELFPSILGELVKNFLYSLACEVLRLIEEIDLDLLRCTSNC